jgi:hypothetical protein
MRTYKHTKTIILCYVYTHCTQSFISYMQRLSLIPLLYVYTYVMFMLVYHMYNIILHMSLETVSICYTIRISLFVLSFVQNEQRDSDIIKHQVQVVYIYIYIYIYIIFRYTFMYLRLQAEFLFCYIYKTKTQLVKINHILTACT